MNYAGIKTVTLFLAAAALPVAATTTETDVIKPGDIMVVNTVDLVDSMTAAADCDCESVSAKVAARPPVLLITHRAGPVRRVIRNGVDRRQTRRAHGGGPIRRVIRNGIDRRQARRAAGRGLFGRRCR